MATWVKAAKKKREMAAEAAKEAAANKKSREEYQQDALAGLAVTHDTKVTTHLASEKLGRHALTFLLTPPRF